MKANIFGVIICSMLFSVKSFAYDDKLVHPAINGHAAIQSNIEGVLFVLGFSDGLDAEFYMGSEKFSVKEWLRQGGTDEDGTSDSKTVDIVQGRYLRHFHDPLYPWADAGLAAFSSNLVWAQKQASLLSGDFSWPAAREHYYQALTTWDESGFAATFLIPGHPSGGA